MYVIPLLVIAVSACGILFIFFRKAKTFAKSEGAHLVYPETNPEKQESETPPLRVFRVGDGQILASFMEKFFRKVRIRLMRLENWLTNVTNRLRARRLKKESDVSQNTDFPEQKEGGEGSENENNVKGEKGGQEGVGSLMALNLRDEKFDEEYWINILKHEPTSAYPYKKLGEIYTAREDYKEARIVFRHALKLDSRDEEARRMLEQLRGKRTKRQSA